MIIDISKLSDFEAYNAITQTIVPRPIAWVLSDNGDTSHNLAPFSYFGVLTSDPALFTLSIAQKMNGEDKDTLRNIEERDFFVAHIPHREQARQVTNSASPLAHGDSEIALLGLELTEFADFPLPRIKQSRIAFGCVRHQILEIGPSAQHLIICEIKTLYIEDSLIDNKPDQPLHVNALKLDPLGRLGGEDYVTLGEVITIPGKTS